MPQITIDVPEGAALKAEPWEWSNVYDRDLKDVKIPEGFRYKDFCEPAEGMTFLSRITHSPLKFKVSGELIGPDLRRIIIEPVPAVKVVKRYLVEVTDQPARQLSKGEWGQYVLGGSIFKLDNDSSRAYIPVRVTELPL